MWRRKKSGVVRSQQAIAEANKSLERVKARDNEVHQVSGALRHIRERNHFAEQLRTIMEGG